ncbi:archaeosine tRNA-ribosyltransferase type 5 [Paraburkholderia unamae]|nr:archaeosine tRNA-ribosyltransferase type 5 [Paraburkholderia unamae]
MFPGKYPEDLMMRFRRIGARKFLRMEGEFAKMDIFGDCGAFSYVDRDVPPYTPEMMLDFYADGGFTHGCSVDHIIFDFLPESRGMKGGSPEARRRFDITLENAEAFLKASKVMGKGFTPLGVIQGWSPESMAIAGQRLEKMGYTYLAIGGMVPLSADQVHQCLQAIRKKLSSKVRLHILGFAKAEQIHEFTDYGIASFDSTSPLTRAFKDAKANYYLPAASGGLEYFTAIRVPQATENARLKRKAKESGVDQERLVKLEQTALRELRLYDRKGGSGGRALNAVLAYNREFLWDAKKSVDANEAALEKTKAAVQRTLDEAPWKRCSCRVCREAGIDAVIFRGSNRNKRRGFHNLAVYHQHFMKFAQ